MLEDRNYVMSEVSKAAGIDPGTAKAWLQRKHIHFDAKPAQKGVPRFLTRNDAARVAIMAALIRVGISAPAAWKATKGFTDLAHGELPGEQGRNPGELFADGQTVLVAYPDQEFGYVFSVRKNEDWNRIAYPILGGRAGKQGGAFVIVNDVLRTFAANLVQSTEARS